MWFLVTIKIKKFKDKKFILRPTHLRTKTKTRAQEEKNIKMALDKNTGMQHDRNEPVTLKKNKFINHGL